MHLHQLFSDCRGANVFAVFRAPRWDGTESVLVSSQFNARLPAPSSNEVSSVGFIASLIQMMKCTSS